MTSRRRFLKGALVGASAVAVGGVARPVERAVAAGNSSSPGAVARARRLHLAEARALRVPSSSPFPMPPALELPMPPGGSAEPTFQQVAAPAGAVARMQDELKVAMAKPLAERKWMMVIDLGKCVGCSACTIACIAENHLPPGVVYRPVLEEEIGTFPNVTRRFIPRPCMQCEEPPCVPVCPVTATYKRDDGVVAIDYNKCIGCRYCILACPYAARYFDFGEHYGDGTPKLQEYEESPSPEYGREWSRGSVEGVVRKCQFCLHRLNAGMLPACVTTCIGGATYFGDANNPESLVNELIASGRAIRLREELGTKPRVHYLV